MRVEVNHRITEQKSDNKYFRYSDDIVLILYTSCPQPFVTCSYSFWTRSPPSLSSITMSTEQRAEVTDEGVVGIFPTPTTLKKLLAPFHKRRGCLSSASVSSLSPIINCITIQKLLASFTKAHLGLFSRFMKWIWSADRYFLSPPKASSEPRHNVLWSSLD